MTIPETYVFTTDGRWLPLPNNPLTEAAGVDPGDGFEEQVKKAGYSEWARFGGAEMVPVWLQVWRRGRDEGKQRRALEYLVSVDTTMSWDIVFAESTPALMELLARWVPVVERATVTQLLNELDEGKRSFGELARRSLGAER